MAKHRVRNIVITTVALLILIIVGGILQSQGFLFAAISTYDTASFELDKYGTHYASPEPLSFALTSQECLLNQQPCQLQIGTWEDDKNKFSIEGERPFTPTETYTSASYNDGGITYQGSPLIIPSTHQESQFNQLRPPTITIKNNIFSKDEKIIFELGKQRPCAGQEFSKITMGINTAGNECTKTVNAPLGEKLVLEWRSSNLQEGLGALFYNGIKICEKQLRAEQQNNLYIKQDIMQGRSCAQDTAQFVIPDLIVWAVGQRVPYNCRIDTSHEQLAVEIFPNNKQERDINLNTFAFNPVAFCPESPVITTCSGAQAGVTGGTEEFLRWSEGKTISVPDNCVKLITYVMDYKRAGLSSGCSSGDRYLVDEQKCESQARIAIAEQTTTGEVQVITHAQTGQVIEQVVTKEQDLYTLDEASQDITRKETRNNTRAYLAIIIGALVMIFIVAIIMLVRRKKK